ncbi:hypothetical protein BD289DRAFT_375936 [Coniella lustricola]|uniref:Capsule polysaccharide biosynthesis protein n=1 Tax=Coniella lustricola TaxID=2025994 RepID=A0A2T2ZXP6_9PEZI|nr:hypothetical protein BD289DRAFT_375936 [Coniella lustricola]
MASASALGWILPLGIGGSVAAAGLSLAHMDVKDLAVRFATGPGRTSRILLALFVVLNWKSMPLMWTYRVLGAIVRQWLPALRPARLEPRQLFHFSITSTYNTLLETDYNMHKSNSTYFADLDVSRSHCVTHLLKPGMDALSNNATSKHPCVLTPDGKPARGGLGIGLGAVFCSFKREVAIGQGYELWTRILAWDRKWVYIVTYFVVKGKVKPRAWDAGQGLGKKSWFGPVRGGRTSESGREKEEGFEKYVIASAVSKYVFKMGRFTVHPAILLDQSGLLPARDGGWVGGENDVWDEQKKGEGEDSNEWTWQRIETQRREGMRFASKFAGLDGLSGVFDGGDDGALGRFYPG